MVRAAEIVSLRALGLSLTQVARVLEGDPQSLESALAAHQATLETKIRPFVGSMDKIRGLGAENGSNFASAPRPAAALCF